MFDVASTRFGGVCMNLRDTKLFWCIYFFFKFVVSYPQFIPYVSLLLYTLRFFLIFRILFRELDLICFYPIWLFFPYYFITVSLLAIFLVNIWLKAIADIGLFLFTSVA